MAYWACGHEGAGFPPFLLLSCLCGFPFSLQGVGLCLGGVSIRSLGVILGFVCLSCSARSALPFARSLSRLALMANIDEMSVPATSASSTRLTANTSPLFRRTIFLQAVANICGRACTGSSARSRWTSSAQAVGRFVTPRALLLQRLHYDPIQLAADQFCEPCRFRLPAGSQRRQRLAGTQPRAWPGRLFLADDAASRPRPPP